MANTAEMKRLIHHATEQFGYDETARRLRKTFQSMGYHEHRGFGVLRVREDVRHIICCDEVGEDILDSRMGGFPLRDPEGLQTKLYVNNVMATNDDILLLFKASPIWGYEAYQQHRFAAGYRYASQLVENIDTYLEFAARHAFEDRLRQAYDEPFDQFDPERELELELRELEIAERAEQVRFHSVWS